MKRSQKAWVSRREKRRARSLWTARCLNWSFWPRYRGRIPATRYRNRGTGFVVTKVIKGTTITVVT